MKAYPYSILEEKVNSVDISIIGVSHNLDFFMEHSKFFYNKVSNSDAIIMEQPVCGDFWDSEFFGSIGEIAHYKKKNIYQADPVTIVSSLLDASQGILGASMMLTGTLEMRMLGMYLLLGSFPGSLSRYLLSRSPDSEDVNNKHDLLMYGNTDQRNVVIAGGIKKICSKVGGIKKVSCIHGAAHSKPIKAYLQYPLLRKFKRMLYLPYEAVSQTKVREYTPSYHGWVLSDMF